jgi:hypothetical protein
VRLDGAERPLGDVGPELVAGDDVRPIVQVDGRIVVGGVGAAAGEIENVVRDADLLALRSVDGDRVDTGAGRELAALHGHAPGGRQVDGVLRRGYVADADGASRVAGRVLVDAEVAQGDVLAE